MHGNGCLGRATAMSMMPVGCVLEAQPQKNRKFAVAFTDWSSLSGNLPSDVLKESGNKTPWKQATWRLQLVRMCFTKSLFHQRRKTCELCYGSVLGVIFIRKLSNLNTIQAVLEYMFPLWMMSVEWIQFRKRMACFGTSFKLFVLFTFKVYVAYILQPYTICTPCTVW